MTWEGDHYDIQFSWTGAHGHFHQFSGTIYAQKGNWSSQLQLSGQLTVDHMPHPTSVTMVHN